MASWMAVWSGAYTTVVVLLAVLQGARSNPVTPWPYLQVYPPLNLSDGRTPLYFALMLSFGGQFASIGALPGVQIALDYINSQPNILPEYSLHYTLTDSQCSRSVALESFFHQIFNSPTKVGWIGSGCSVATERTAELTQFYNITQLSCVSGSPALSNREKFRYYYQFLSGFEKTAEGYASLIRFYGWKKVTIITQDVNLYSKIMDSLKRMLTEYGVEYTEKMFTTAESIDGLGPQPFQDTEARIYVLALYSGHARPLICEAYKQGLRYPTHQFLIPGWYSDGWLEEPDPMRDIGCTLEERIRTLNYALAVEVSQRSSNMSLVTEGDLTFAEFHEQYWRKINSSVNDKLNLKESVTTYLKYVEQCHEATVALAYALHNSSRDFKENRTLSMAAAQEAGLPPGEEFTLANFSYVNSVVVERMFHHLKNPGFLGITGNKVTFDSNGTRDIDKLLILQYLPGKSGESEVRKVGVVARSSEGDPFFQHNEDVTETLLWPDGVPPSSSKTVATGAIPFVVLSAVVVNAIV